MLGGDPSLNWGTGKALYSKAAIIHLFQSMFAGEVLGIRRSEKISDSVCTRCRSSIAGYHTQTVAQTNKKKNQMKTKIKRGPFLRPGNCEEKKIIGLSSRMRFIRLFLLRFFFASFVLFFFFYFFFLASGTQLPRVYFAWLCPLPVLSVPSTNFGWLKS